MVHSWDNKQLWLGVDREVDARAVIQGRRIPVQMASNDHHKCRCRCRCRKTRQWQGYSKWDIVIQVLSGELKRVECIE